MTNDAINIILWILLFCLALWCAKYVCAAFGLPQPILWVVGVLFLVVLLLFLSGQLVPPPIFRAR